MNLLSSSFAKISSSIESSPIAVGTTNLLNDITSWMVGLSVGVGGAVIVYSALRMGASSNQQDKEDYKKRMKTAIVGTIIATLASSLLKLVVGYYQ